MSVKGVSGNRPVQQQASPMEEAASFATGSDTSVIAEAMIQLQDAQQSARKMRREARRRQLEAQERQIEHMRRAADYKLMSGILDGAEQLGEVGFDAAIAREQELTSKAIEQTQALPEEVFVGESKQQALHRLQQQGKADVDQLESGRKLMRTGAKLLKAVTDFQAADAEIDAKQAGMEAEVAREAAQDNKEAANASEKHMDRAMDALKQINQARRDAERAANRV